MLGRFRDLGQQLPGLPLGKHGQRGAKWDGWAVGL